MRCDGSGEHADPKLRIGPRSIGAVRCHHCGKIVIMDSYSKLEAHTHTGWRLSEIAATLADQEQKNETANPTLRGS